tara:strand:+ start:6516 stop:6695 length:180 start_codon:yes stop_codon:yes gene_type:complete
MESKNITMEEDYINNLIEKAKSDLVFHTDKAKQLKIQIDGYELLIEDIKIRDRKKQFTA